MIGNGDVTTPAAAKRMFEETGCAGVSMGRGAFYNPWIFLQTRQFLLTGREPEEASLEERLAFMHRHLAQMTRFFGERKGCLHFRKVAQFYVRRIGPAAFFRRRIESIDSVESFEALVNDFREWRCQFLDERGELQPRFRPTAPRVVFAGDEPVETEDHAIAVPKGPVAIW